ncbi:MAG: RNA pseudouridine synthase [Hyphomicrobiaceae bacterium]|nr:RNA pseudouridine synthase [Hyphomicrobiaceae bacterium]
MASATSRKSAPVRSVTPPATLEPGPAVPCATVGELHVESFRHGTDVQTHTFTVDLERAGDRADRFLAAALSGLSRSRIQALIGAGQAMLDGERLLDAGHRLKPGEAVTITVPPPEVAEPAGENLALTIVYEDDALIVVDKPAGLVVHPSAGHEGGTLVNALIAHCGDSLSGIGGVKRPGIVHRLDKDTTGLIVVAKTDAAHAGLARQFAAHGRDGRLQREYVAIVWGALPAITGTIDAPLARSQANRTRMQVVPKGSRSRIGLGGRWIDEDDIEAEDDGPNGQNRTGGSRAPREAITHYRVEETFMREALRDAPREHGKGSSRPIVPLASQLRVVLETGRTHQIRVHMAHIGHPVLGDPTYGAGFKSSERRLDDTQGGALTALGRQALHAAVLGFEHPVTGRPLRFESPLPSDMTALADALRGGPAPAAVTAAKRSRKKPAVTKGIVPTQRKGQAALDGGDDGDDGDLD